MPTAWQAAQLRWKLEHAHAGARDEPERDLALDLPRILCADLERLGADDGPRARMYDQSMSGRKCSQLTLPFEARSIATTNPTPSLCPQEMAFFKYPTEVEQREANTSRLAGDSELRNSSRFSITHILPAGKVKAIPAAHLPASKTGYDPAMSDNRPQSPAMRARDRVYVIRRTRLRKLVEQYTTLTEFAEIVDEPLSYISRLLQAGEAGRKNMGEGKARKFEAKLGLPPGWFDTTELSKLNPKPVPIQRPWPFRFPQKVWDNLSASERRKVEDQLLIFIQLVEAARDQRKETG